MLVCERMDRRDDKEEYERMACERLTDIRLTVEEEVSISEAFRVFKDTVAAEVVGYRALRVQRKGNVWLNEGEEKSK